MKIDCEIFKTIDSNMEKRNLELNLIDDGLEKRILSELNNYFTQEEILRYKQYLINYLNSDSQLLLELKHYIAIGYNFKLGRHFKYYSKDIPKEYFDVPENVMNYLIFYSLMDFKFESIKYYRNKNDNSEDDTIIYELNYENQLFDNLENNTLVNLDNIIQTVNETKTNKKLKKTYIDNNLWNEFLNISKIQTKNIRVGNSIVKSTHTFFGQCKEGYGKMSNDETVEELEYDYVGEFYFEEQLLYMFLSMLFRNNVHFIVKKCEICHKYFVTTTANTKFCNRIQSNGLTHIEQKNKSKSLYSNIPIIRKMDKYITRKLAEESLSYNNIDKLEQYKSGLKKAKENGTAFQYLNNYYSSPNTKEKHIQEYKAELDKK